MALVVGVRASDQPAHKAWLFRTRPLFLPAISLAVWVLFSARFLPLFSSLAWGNLRWVCLAALAIQGLLEIWKWGGDTPIPLPIAGFLLFSLATFASVTYSLIPLLSLYKAVSFLLALVALVLGIGLRHRGRPDSWIRLLATFNAVVLGLSVLLLVAPGSYDSALYRGPFENSNSLGSSLALTLPALLWLREKHRREAPLLLRSKLLTAAVVVELLLVFLTRSRASLLAVAVVLVLHAFLRGSRFAWLVVYAMVVLLLISPAAAEQVGRNAAYKGRDQQAAFTVRVEQFDATLQAAASSPIAGYGYGMSKGRTEWDGSLAVFSVGREKSNSFLAAIEEVGLVGGIPLFIALAAACWAAFGAARRERRTGDGTTAALLGIMAAGLVNANFEAWLTAVGSFEGFIFWSTMGVLLMNAQRSESRSMDAGG